MITFVSGDILKSPAQVIANPINCAGVMGKGLALQFKKAFPKFDIDYVARCKAGTVHLGEPYMWEDGETQILAFPTKGHWREKSTLDSIEKGLICLAKNYDELGITTLALPALGCGNGGLEWKSVSELIVRHLGEIKDLEVFVFEPSKPVEEESYSSSSESDLPRKIAARPADF